MTTWTDLDRMLTDLAERHRLAEELCRAAAVEHYRARAKAETLCRLRTAAQTMDACEAALIQLDGPLVLDREGNLSTPQGTRLYLP